MLRNPGHNIIEFLQNLDSLYALQKRDFPDVAPSIRCDEDFSTDRMILQFDSKRSGLNSVVKGTYELTL